MDKIYKSLADPTRREILRLLRAGPLSAGEIAAHFALTRATMSGHFSVLREAGLIHGEKTGTTIRYCLHLSVLEEALNMLMSRFSLGGAQTQVAALKSGTRHE